MLSWSVRQLAQQCAISESTIRRIEADFDVPQKVQLETLIKLKTFFEGRGFRFFWDDGGPGLQWRRGAERRSGVDRRGGGSLNDLETQSTGDGAGIRA